jgi:hypothetical protein
MKEGKRNSFPEFENRMQAANPRWPEVAAAETEGVFHARPRAPSNAVNLEGVY